MVCSKRFAAAFLGAGFLATPLLAQSITLSLGIRETGSVEPIGGNGGSSGGIEWVNIDANVVPLDGGWHQVTVDLRNATLTAFAGATANSMYDGTRGTIEHIRIRNTDGITNPIRMFLDDLVVTDAAGAPTTLGWEGLTVGQEHIFQEPTFSGSTSPNLVVGGGAGVTEAAAFSGTQAYDLNFQFVDNSPTRWVRLTTSAPVSGANPTIDFGGTVSFQVRGMVIPAPAGVGLLGLGALVLVRRRR